MHAQGELLPPSHEDEEGEQAVPEADPRAEECIPSFAQQVPCVHLGEQQDPPHSEEHPEEQREAQHEEGEEQPAEEEEVEVAGDEETDPRFQKMIWTKIWTPTCLAQEIIWMRTLIKCKQSDQQQAASKLDYYWLSS